MYVRRKSMPQQWQDKWDAQTAPPPGKSFRALLEEGDMRAASIIPSKSSMVWIDMYGSKGCREQPLARQAIRCLSELYDKMPNFEERDLFIWQAVYLCVTIFASQEIRSNLTVESMTTLCNALHNYGDTVISGLPTSNYTPELSLSNALGTSTLVSYASNLGLKQPNPAYTLDVNGDINFSGKIYQNGAIFSGWNSDAYGNYINSNAAFLGPATSNDALLIYTASNSFNSNMAVPLSNASGISPLWSVSSNLGLQQSNPAYTFDVTGSMHVTSNAMFDTLVGVGTLTPGYPIDVQANYAGVSVPASYPAPSPMPAQTTATLRRSNTPFPQQGGRRLALHACPDT